MNTKRLIELLQMFPDDTAIYIQTVPDDYASPLGLKNIGVWKASVDKIQDTIVGINREKIVLTSFFPEKP